MKPFQETGPAYSGRMQPFHIFVSSFLDGFVFPGLFGKLARPGAPEYLFAQPEEIACSDCLDMKANEGVDEHEREGLVVNKLAEYGLAEDDVAASAKPSETHAGKNPSHVAH